MKWELTDVAFGDMIRVKSGSIYHYGIFASEDEVLQFGLAPVARQNIKDCDIEVCSSDISTFLQGGFLEVAVLDKNEKKRRFDAEKTVELARSSIGQRGYNILYNNCEHFAYRCVFGKSQCTQTDDVRLMFRNMFKSLPICHLYISEIPDGEITADMLEKIYPESRRKEIASCSNPQLIRQKFYAWKLLEYALLNSFGYNISRLELNKSANGKWTSPACCFSISHSGDAVAVAVSRDSIGVDVQLPETPHPITGLNKKILTFAESKQYEALPECERNQYVMTKWTQKESIFKTFDHPCFRPSKINVADYPVNTRRVLIGDKEYILSVTSRHIDELKYHHKSITEV